MPRKERRVLNSSIGVPRKSVCAPKKSKKIYTKSTWSGRDPLVKPACIEGAVLKPSRTIVDNSSGVTRTVFFSGTQTAVDYCMIWYIVYG